MVDETTIAQVMGQMGEGPALGNDQEARRKYIEDQMRQELGTEGEGGDSWYSERTRRLIESIGPDTFYTLPATEALNILGMGQDDPALVRLYENSPPDQRAALVRAIGEGAGMATAEQLQGMVQEQSQPQTPTDVEQGILDTLTRD